MKLPRTHTVFRIICVFVVSILVFKRKNKTGNVYKDKISFYSLFTLINRGYSSFWSEYEIYFIE